MINITAMINRALPGQGSMRFGLRSKSVENVNDVKTSLITSGEMEDPKNTCNIGDGDNGSGDDDNGTRGLDKD